MPQENSERNNKNCRDVFWRRGFWRLLSSFINNPTLTRRNLLYVISVSCGNSQGDTIYQLWLHVQSASTDLACFCFLFRSYLQPALGIFHHVKYVYLGLIDCFSLMHIPLSPPSPAFHAHQLLTPFNSYTFFFPSSVGTWGKTQQQSLRSNFYFLGSSG